MFTSGPPLLPGLTAASVWMKSSYRFRFRLLRLLPLTMPCVTDPMSPNGAPHGQHLVADFHCAAIAELEERQRFLGVELDDGNVGLGVSANVLGGEFAAVLQRDLHDRGVAHDVVVRDDDAAGVDDESGTETGVDVVELARADFPFPSRETTPGSTRLTTGPNDIQSRGSAGALAGGSAAAG